MTTNPSHDRSTADQEADRMKAQTRQSAGEMGDSVKEQAKAVKSEAADQAKSLASSVSDEASDQAANQQQRLAGQSRILSDDLQRISRGEPAESDMVNRFVSQAADQAQKITHHLENKEPRELLDDVRRFASRRPGLFIAIAAGIGIAAGRLTRGMTDSDDDAPSARSSRPQQYGQVSAEHRRTYPDEYNRPYPDEYSRAYPDSYGQADPDQYSRVNPAEYGRTDPSEFDQPYPNETGRTI